MTDTQVWLVERSCSLAGRLSQSHVARNRMPAAHSYTRPLLVTLGTDPCAGRIEYAMSLHPFIDLFPSLIGEEM